MLRASEYVSVIMHMTISKYVYKNGCELKCKPTRPAILVLHNVCKVSLKILEKSSESLKRTSGFPQSSPKN